MAHADAPPRQSVRWHVRADAAAWQAEAFERVTHAAREALARRARFDIVLAGGNTPRALYGSLRAFDTDWRAWHVWYGDERCVPANDPQRNSRMADDAWLRHIPIPATNVHAIPGELGAEVAARQYAIALATLPMFDLVLLGLGEDGHTASLFPGHPWGQAPDAPAALVVHAAPKPPPDRVSLSAHRLGLARKVLFLVEGAGKRAAVAAWQRGDTIPAAAIAPESGVDVLLDQAAVAA